MRLPIVVLASVVGLAVAVAPAQAQQPPAALEIALDGTPLSQEPFDLRVRVRDAAGQPVTGVEVAVALTGHREDEAERRAVSDASGEAVLRVAVWREATVTAASGAVMAQALVRARPVAAALRMPATAPSPRSPATPDPPAAGAGANAVITPLPADLRASMRGVSWEPGCLPMSALRLVRVNYLGVDGYRHRGAIVVASSVAASAARALAALHDRGVRVRSMHPVDAYGRTPGGIGADDLASMRAGNTSGFNCRYIVGRERARRMSPHATGRAIDLNPWENPYRSSAGILPNRWWWEHRDHPLAMRWQSEAVRAMRSAGWSWGASFGDLHHFGR